VEDKNKTLCQLTGQCFWPNAKCRRFLLSVRAAF